jgi:hypothetical protein
VSLFALTGLVGAPVSPPSGGLAGGAPPVDAEPELSDAAAENGVLQAILGMMPMAPLPSAAPPRSPEAFALDPNAAGLGFAPRPTIGGSPPAALASADGLAGLWQVERLVQGAPAPPPAVPPAALPPMAGPQAATVAAQPPAGRLLPPPSAPGPARGPAAAPLTGFGSPAAASALSALSPNVRVVTPKVGGRAAEAPSSVAPSTSSSAGLVAALSARAPQAPSARLPNTVKSAPAAAGFGEAAQRSSGAVRTFSDAPWLALDSAGGELAGAEPLSEATLDLDMDGLEPPLSRAAGGEARGLGMDTGRGAPTLATAPEGGRPADPDLRAATPKPTPELSAPLPERLELRIDEGGQGIRVAVTKEEAGGYAVELRSPRELVPELRALRSELETALGGEDEQGLASFDASADDQPADPEEPSAGTAEGDPRGQGTFPARARRPPMPAPRPLRLLDRFV